MGKYDHLIHKLEGENLDMIAAHKKVPFIKRFADKKPPVHLGVHEISYTKNNKDQYSELHFHNARELNIILSSGKKGLKYDIVLGEERYIVKAPSAIWIPEGLKHSANVLSGEGYYICIKF